MEGRKTNFNTVYTYTLVFDLSLNLLTNQLAAFKLFTLTAVSSQVLHVCPSAERTCKSPSQTIHHEKGIPNI